MQIDLRNDENHNFVYLYLINENKYRIIPTGLLLA